MRCGESVFRNLFLSEADLRCSRSLAKHLKFPGESVDEMERMEINGVLPLMSLDRLLIVFFV
jgi:hypothetical protein